MRQKFSVKSVVVIAEMLVIGSASLYFIQQAYPGGGFIRDLLAITIAGLVASLFSFTLEDSAKRKYLLRVSALVALLLLTACWVKVSFKTTLAYACSVLRFDVSNGDPLDPSTADPNFIPEQEKWTKYWQNY